MPKGAEAAAKGLSKDRFVGAQPLEGGSFHGVGPRALARAAEGGRKGLKAPLENLRTYRRTRLVDEV